jgi:hypothetical protein
LWQAERQAGCQAGAGISSNQLALSILSRRVHLIVQEWKAQRQGGTGVSSNQLAVSIICLAKCDVSMQAGTGVSSNQLAIGILSERVHLLVCVNAKFVCGEKDGRQA